MVECDHATTTFLVNHVDTLVAASLMYTEREPLTAPVHLHDSIVSWREEVGVGTESELGVNDWYQFIFIDVDVLPWLAMWSPTIATVLRTTDPSEIVDGVVERVAINVVHLRQVIGIGNESFRDEPMLGLHRAVDGDCDVAASVDMFVDWYEFVSRDEEW